MIKFVELLSYMEKMKQKIYNLKTDVQDTHILTVAKNVLIKNNILTLEHLTNFTKKEIKSLKGMGTLGLASIEIVLKEVGLRFKKEVKPKDDLIDLKRKLILKLLKNTEDINWANEIKAATILLKNDPDIEFWHRFILPFKLNSLYFLLSEKGKSFIYAAKQKKKEIKTFAKEEVSLEEKKIGEDIVVHKPKSIKDFLNE